MGLEEAVALAAGHLALKSRAALLLVALGDSTARMEEVLEAPEVLIPEDSTMAVDPPVAALSMAAAVDQVNMAAAADPVSMEAAVAVVIIAVASTTAKAVEVSTARRVALEVANTAKAHLAAPAAVPTAALAPQPRTQHLQAQQLLILHQQVDHHLTLRQLLAILHQLLDSPTLLQPLPAHIRKQLPKRLVHILKQRQLNPHRQRSILKHLRTPSETLCLCKQPRQSCS